MPHDELLAEAHALAERITKNALAHRSAEHEQRITKWKTR